MRPLHKYVRFINGDFTRYLDHDLNNCASGTRQTDPPQHNRFIVYAGQWDNAAMFTITNDRHPFLLRLAAGRPFGWASTPGIYNQDMFYLFDHDYPAMRTANAVFRGQLLAHVMHPDNVKRLPGIGLLN
jgi:hypothetical protein